MDSFEVVVELSKTERKLAEGTVGLGALVCFVRKHDFGTYMKMIGEIRLLTERKGVDYAVVTLKQRPERHLAKHLTAK